MSKGKQLEHFSSPLGPCQDAERSEENPPAFAGIGKKHHPSDIFQGSESDLQTPDVVRNSEQQRIQTK